MMKCKKCGENKEEKKFYKDSARKSGYRYCCKKCTTTQPYKEQAKIRIANNKYRNRKNLLELFSKSACKDCGNNNILVLEFDHIRDKKYNISKILAQTWEYISKEIEKCDIVCANCHRIRSYNRRPCYRNNEFLLQGLENDENEP